MADQAGSRMQQLRIIWLAIVSSVIIYGLIAWVTIEHNAEASTEELYSFVSNPLSFALAIAAMAAFFASILVPGMMIRSRRHDRRSALSTPPASAFDVTPEVLTAMIVRYAFLETPAVLGLVGAFILGEWRFFLPFGFLSLIGLALTLPTTSFLRSVDETNR